MALLTPDYLQTKTYAAKRDRRVSEALVIQEGIVDFGDFKVSQRGAGANMSVDVSSGEAWVDGDSSVDQGFYHVVNDATVNVAISNNSSGNPRIDTIVLRVNDSADAGSGSDTPALEVVVGTPTAAATLANLKGIAALPNTALPLAYVLVANGAVSIGNASIGYLVDPQRGKTGFPAVAEPKAIEGAPAPYAHGRPLGYVPATRVRRTTNQVVAAREVINFDAEIFDVEDLHSNVTNPSRITFKTPGFYQLFFSTTVSVASTALLIGKNGAAEANDIAATVAPNAALDGNLSVIERFGYGDFAVCYASAVTINAVGPRSPVFAAAWIGP